MFCLSKTHKFKKILFFQDYDLEKYSLFLNGFSYIIFMIKLKYHSLGKMLVNFINKNTEKCFILHIEIFINITNLNEFCEFSLFFSISNK